MISMNPRPSSRQERPREPGRRRERSSAVSDERMPSLSSFALTEVKPGEIRVDEEQREPVVPSPLSVRVTRTQKSARMPFVMKIFRPLMT